MILIRHAELFDLDVIWEMSQKFYAETGYKDLAEIDEQTTRDLAAFMIDNGVLLLAVDGESGAVIGMVGCIVTPYHFNRNIITAHEVMWYVETAYQSHGAGQRLFDECESECRAMGVSGWEMITLESSPPQAAALYLKKGMRRMTSGFMKVL